MGNTVGGGTVGLLGLWRRMRLLPLPLRAVSLGIRGSPWSCQQRYRSPCDTNKRSETALPARPASELPFGIRSALRGGRSEQHVIFEASFPFYFSGYFSFSLHSFSQRAEIRHFDSVFDVFDHKILALCDPSRDWPSFFRMSVLIQVYNAWEITKDKSCNSLRRLAVSHHSYDSIQKLKEKEVSPSQQCQ